MTAMGTLDNAAPEPRAMAKQVEPTYRSVFISILLLSLGIVWGILAQDEYVGCLEDLNIRFGGVLYYTCLIAPAIAWVVWLVTCRWYRNASVVGAVSLWILIIFGVNQYAWKRIYAFPIGYGGLSDQAIQAVAQLPFPARYHAFLRYGNAVIVENDPEKVARLTEMLSTVRRFRPIPTSRARSESGQ
jgi:hypothetical protein